MSKKCIQCGAELEDWAAFCDECGAKQPDVSNMSKPMENKQFGELKKDSKMGIASFVMGVISLYSFGCILIPQILGVVFGIIAIANKDKKHTLAIIGLSMSIIGFILLAFVLISE